MGDIFNCSGWRVPIVTVSRCAMDVSLPFQLCFNTTNENIKSENVKLKNKGLQDDFKITEVIHEEFAKTSRNQASQWHQEEKRPNSPPQKSYRSCLSPNTRSSWVVCLWTEGTGCYHCISKTRDLDNLKSFWASVQSTPGIPVVALRAVKQFLSDFPTGILSERTNKYQRRRHKIKERVFIGLLNLCIHDELQAQQKLVRMWACKLKVYNKGHVCALRFVGRSYECMAEVCPPWK